MKVDDLIFVRMPNGNKLLMRVTEVNSETDFKATSANIDDAMRADATTPIIDYFPTKHCAACDRPKSSLDADGICHTCTTLENDTCIQNRTAYESVRIDRIKEARWAARNPK